MIVYVCECVHVWPRYYEDLNSKIKIEQLAHTAAPDLSMDWSSQQLSTVSRMRCLRALLLLAADC